MHRLILLGLNHTTAPLAVREKLSFNSERRQLFFESLRTRYPACEAVLLSTCNRLEVYVGRQAEPHAPPRQAELIELLAVSAQIDAEELKPLLYHHTERAVVQHLFRVAASLDSMVVGETQILGQVREAYDAAATSGLATTMLNPLFQRAIAVGKQVIHQTTLTEGRLSVAAIAVDYAKQIFDTFNDKTVLTIGAGKMASLVLSNLASLSPGNLLICNRDPEKAAALAQQYGGEAVQYETLADQLARADIVVTSTGSREPIITRKLFETVMRKRRNKPVFLIDIAVPRDIAEDVAEIENAYLYNLDDLQQVAAKTRTQRTAAMDHAEQIVQQQADEFVSWHRARQLGPMIDQLFRRSHAMAQEELNRVLNKMENVTPQQQEQLEELTRRIVNKILHDPVQRLRDSDGMHGPTSQYVHAMEKLFKLSDTPDEPPKS